MRLHIGSGAINLEGWVNVDRAPYPGVTHVLDIRAGLPFSEVDYIFCEHFVEHLTLREGLQFLRECRQALSPDGVLRISTPNLDWVWLTHYRPPGELVDGEAVTACLELNRAFHGWGHKFLYNRATLSAALRDSGFRDLKEFAFGESDIEALQNLERHERSPDHAAAPHILIIEASGRSTVERDFNQKLEPYLRDVDCS
ncbi:MAG: methyltransferase domain-containing protein [Acidobacteriota bacterium]